MTRGRSAREMELEEDDEEDGDIGERGGFLWGGGAVAVAGRPAPKLSAPQERTSGLARGRRTLLGEGGCWDPRQVSRGTGRRKRRCPPAVSNVSFPAADLPPPGSARGGRASGWPWGRPGRRGSVSGRARDEGPDRAS